MRWMWVLSLLLLAPFAQASTTDTVEVGIDNPQGPTPVTLWMHRDGLQDMLLSTQAAPANHQVDTAMGVATHSQTCTEDQPGPLGQMHHTYYARLQRQALEYTDEGIEYRTHHAGVGDDLKLDLESAPSVTWSMSSQLIGDDRTGVDQVNQVPAVIPQVTVRATLREGDDISVQNQALNEGRLIAQGATQPATLHPGIDHPQIEHSQVDDRHVYDFQVPMAFADHPGHVDQREAFNLRIDVFVDNPACDGSDEFLMPDWLRFHSSEGHRPALDLSIMNPLRTEYLHPQIIDDDVVIHGAFQSVWGTHDIDIHSLHAELLGGDVDEMVIHDPTCYEHNCSDDVIRKVTAILERPDPGMQYVRMSVSNLQGTATTSAVVAFDIGDGTLHACDTDGDRVVCTKGVAEESNTPAVFLPLLASLVVLAWVRRP